MVNVTLHALPINTRLLAPPIQGPMPVADHLCPKRLQAAEVRGNSVVAAMPFHYGLEPLAYLWHRVVHSLSELKLYLFELGSHFLLPSLAPHRKHSVAPLLSTDMCEAEKVKCLRFSPALLLGIVDRIRTKFNNFGLIWMQLQRKLGIDQNNLSF